MNLSYAAPNSLENGHNKSDPTGIKCYTSAILLQNGSNNSNPKVYKANYMTANLL